MIDRVSRKNRRNNPPTIRTILPVFLLTLSSIVLIGGIGNLAWALTGQKTATENKQNVLETSLNAPEKDPYNGRILAANELPSTASSSSSASSSASTPIEGTAEPEPSRSDAAAFDQDDRAQGTNQATAEVASPSPSSEAPAQQSYTVYHNASEEVPIYRTVHHQASTPKEIKTGGYTRIEWTRCPVCDQVHESAFNERVVDHMSQSTCSACGGIHSESYEEVVYY